MLRRLADVNRKLEELGLTHIKNRAVILRKLNNYEDNEALTTLSRLCEPLKIYSRNAEGTEYKTFSPFTLFADACVADAADALTFNRNVDQLINNANKDVINLIKNDLEGWSKLNDSFATVDKNPNTTPLKPLAINLSEASKILVTAFSNKKITPLEHDKLSAILIVLEGPFMDTELAILRSLKKLLTYCETNYLTR